jgi:hypothetical protein
MLPIVQGTGSSYKYKLGTASVSKWSGAPTLFLWHNFIINHIIYFPTQSHGPAPILCFFLAVGFSLALFFCYSWHIEFCDLEESVEYFQPLEDLLIRKMYIFVNLSTRYLFAIDDTFCSWTSQNIMSPHMKYKTNVWRIYLVKSNVPYFWRIVGPNYKQKNIW